MTWAVVISGEPETKVFVGQSQPEVEERARQHALAILKEGALDSEVDMAEYRLYEAMAYDQLIADEDFAFLTSITSIETVEVSE